MSYTYSLELNKTEAQLSCILTFALLVAKVSNRLDYFGVVCASRAWKIE